MTTMQPLFRWTVRASTALAVALLCATATARDFNVGDIAIRQPFATPSLAGTSSGVAYLASLENKGASPERLVRASTPVAASVELHTMAVDAQGVMRMRDIDGIALAPKSNLQMQPGSGMHLMLIGLKAPLKEGTSFPMTLQFERAGTVQVTVDVHQSKAKAAAASAPMHMH